MQAWMIISITVLSGLLLFSIIFFIKKRMSERQRRQNSVVMYNNTNTIPSTNNAPAYNMGTPPPMYQYQTVQAQQIYPNQQQFQHPPPPGVIQQGYPGQQHQLYPPSTPSGMPMPQQNVPTRY